MSAVVIDRQRKASQKQLLEYKKGESDVNNHCTISLLAIFHVNLTLSSYRWHESWAEELT